MSTATKLSYLNETKGLIKDAINDLGGEIDNNTTFREYANVLNDIYDNLPKATGTGTSLSLSPTVKGKLELTLNPTELTQASTPTPSSPQDVHVISGDNSIVVNNANLLLTNNTTETTLNSVTFTPMGNGQYKLNGTASALTDYYLLSYNYSTTNELLKGGVTYYIKEFIEGTHTRYNICSLLYTDDGNTIKTLIFSEAQVGSGYAFTLENDAYLRGFKITTPYNSEWTNAIVSCQISTSNPTSYTPYQTPQTQLISLGNIEYCKIGNYSDRIFKTSGKNLFDKSTITSGKYINSSGVITDYYAYSISDYIEIEPSTLYSYQGISDYSEYGAFYDNSKTLISAFQESAVVENQNFTTPSNAKYVRFTLINTNQDINKFQLEKGSKTDYEPYGSNEWYLKKNIGKVVLDGSEEWGYVYAYYHNGYYTSISNILKSTAYIDQALLYSNYFNGYSVENLFENNVSNYGISRRTNQSQIIIRNDNVSDVEGLKTWLSNNNTSVYYPLATPTYTQITGTLATQLENACNKMKSYNGTTNVSQVNDDLAFNLSGSCLLDLNSLVDE